MITDTIKFLDSLKLTKKQNISIALYLLNCATSDLEDVDLMNIYNSLFNYRNNKKH